MNTITGHYLLNPRHRADLAGNRVHFVIRTDGATHEANINSAGFRAVSREDAAGLLKAARASGAIESVDA